MENDYYVIESKLYNVGNKLECEYVLGKQLDYFVDPIPHEKIRGTVQSEADKYAGKSYFPYVMPYRQSNTGFTPAPETGDRVALYFPSENETHALVMGAVNNNGNGRFTNPDKRNFTLGPSQAARGGTPANEGKPMYNFTLDSEKFIVSVGSIISLSSGGTVGITGTSNVDIASTGANATLSAGQNIDITANQDATVTASSGIATLSGNTYANVKGNQNAEIVGGHNTNVGLCGGKSSNKTIVVGSSKVEVKSGEVEIN